jgi:signal peptidase I
VNREGTEVVVEGEASDCVPPTRTTKRSRLRSPWLFVLVALGSLLALLVLLRLTMFEAFVAESASMAPTLHDSERVLVDKAVYGLFLPLASRQSVSWGMPVLGDVVVFRHPADRADLIKRVVALPGDRIFTAGTRVERNGAILPHAKQVCPRPLQPEPGGALHCFREQNGARTYTVAYDDVPSALFAWPETTVPADHVYVLGDHRTRSDDSRNPAMGPIHRSQLKGRATYIYWSPYPGRALQRIE